MDPTDGDSVERRPSIQPAGLDQPGSIHPMGGLRIASIALLVLLGLCCCVRAAEFNGFDDITGCDVVWKI